MPKKTEPPLPPFARRLAALRKAAGLTFYALGKKAGVSQQTIAHLERGRNGPTWEVVQKLADALGVEVERFRE